jgi:anti-sigma factor NepR-like protein
LPSERKPIERKSIEGPTDRGIIVSDEKKTEVSAKAQRAGPRRGSTHRDQWFDSELNRIYDDVLSEPLPKDLADLVAKLKSKKPGE